MTSSVQSASLAQGEKPNAALQQKLPFGIGRYVLVVLYALIIFVRGCTYWGWNGIQEMLYKSGGYSWLCDESDEIGSMRVGSEEYVDCADRKNAIGIMCTIAFASHLISSAFSGVLLDRAGPKICMLCAITVDSLAWILLAFSNQSFQAFIPACIMLGVAADPGYLPLLSLSHLFPGNGSFVISVFGSLRSISFSIPVILAAIFSSSSFVPGDLWKLLVGYVGVCQGMCVILTVFFVPMCAFKDGESLEQEKRAMEDADKSAVEKPGVEKSEAPVEDQKTFKECALSPRFLLLLPVFAFALMRGEFYTKSNKEQLKVSTGGDLYNLFSIFNILSFLPGPVFGKLTDMFGITIILSVLNFAGILMYAFLMLDYYWSKLVSILCFFIYTSFVLSNAYCYVALYFPSSHFGKLAGLASLFSGCLLLSSIGFYEMSSEALLSLSPKNFLPADGVMIFFGLVVYVFVFCMWRIDKREKATKKVYDDVNSPAADTQGSVAV